MQAVCIYKSLPVQASLPPSHPAYTWTNTFLSCTAVLAFHHHQSLRVLKKVEMPILEAGRELLQSAGDTDR